MPSAVPAKDFLSHGNPRTGYFGLLTSDYRVHRANLTGNVMNFVYGAVSDSTQVSLCVE
jgi:hypothetical protein